MVHIFDVLKQTLNVNQNDVDISKFPRVVPYVKKKSALFTQDQIIQFLNHAPETEFLDVKVS